MSRSRNRFPNPAIDPVSPESKGFEFDVLKLTPTRETVFMMEAAYGVPRDLTALDLAAIVINQGLLEGSTEGHPRKTNRFWQFYKGIDLACASLEYLCRERHEEEPILLVASTPNAIGFRFAVENFFPNIDGVTVDLEESKKLTTTGNSGLSGGALIISEEKSQFGAREKLVIQSGAEAVEEIRSRDGQFVHSLYSEDESNEFFRIARQTLRGN